MQNAKKMMVIPVEQAGAYKVNDGIHLKTEGKTTEGQYEQEVKGKRLKFNAAVKIEKILKIILALARINGYDENGRIRSGDAFLEKSDIVALMNNVISPRKILIGEQAFIQLLIEANIDPGLITNDNVRFAIETSKTSNSKLAVSENKPTTIKTLSTRSEKRRREESADDEFEEPLKKKTLSNWTIPYDSDNDF